MKDDKIPDSDNISRFCRPMQVIEAEIQATAFMLRKDEKSLIGWSFLNVQTEKMKSGQFKEYILKHFLLVLKQGLPFLMSVKCEIELAQKAQITEIFKSYTIQVLGVTNHTVGFIT